MDSNCGIFVIFLVFQLFGNACGQPGGVAIGLGLGGDFMVDTAFGELPSPLVAMATQGAQRSNPPPTHNTAAQTGGGFNANSFSLFGSDPNFIFPLDASQIAGVTNGQTIYLPGLVGNPLLTGTSGTSSNRHSAKPAESNTNYILRNEDFTALGNVGHLVRVPADSKSTRSNVVNVGTGGKHAGISWEHSGLISINPNDIIGVADMSQPQPMGSGGSGMFNFNPGTGHASEISALQSGLSGSAVDMTSFLPPPFDGPPAPVQNQPPTSSLPATPVDNSNVASSPMDPPASIPNNMRTDSNLFSGPSVNSNMNSVDQSSMFSNMPANFNAPSITNEIGPPMPSLKQDSMFGPSEVSANTQGVDTTNYNVLDMNQTSTLDIAINRGNVGSNPFSSPFSNPNNPSIVNAPRDTGVINEHSVFEESMFNAPMPTDTGLLTDTANTGTATTDASSVSMFDMEMNMGVGTSSGNAVNPPVNVANSPTNTQFNEFNRMDMAGPHSSRFGVVGSRFGSLNVPNNIGRSSNQHIQDAIRHNAVPPPPTMGEPGISTQNTAVTSNSPVATVNDTHVNDLNSEGIYPFEGNMNAMDASFSEAKSAITDMNRVLIGHEPLHLEPTGVPQSSSTNQAIDPAMNNPGMLDVSNRTVEVTYTNNDSLSNNQTENGTNIIDVIATDNKSSILDESNNLLQDKINEYIGTDTNLTLNHNTSLQGDLIGLDVNISTNTLVDVNEHSNNKNLSKDFGMPTVMGTTINNDFAISNALISDNNNNKDSITNTITNKETNAAIADMVGSSSISGFGSGPITNLVGVVPGKANSGGMAVSDFNSQMHEFSTLADNTGSISNPTMSTFDIGAGQPDATVISQENIAPVNELASLNVGGTALGSQSFDFGRISLPDTAFVSDKTNTNVPTQPEVNRPLKVDMSNFLPPPFMTEELGGPSNVIPDITMGTDQFNQNAPPFHQNAINSPSKEALPEPSQPPAVHQPTVQSRPMSMLADEFRSISEVNPGHHAQPVVGSIFGTTDMTNSTVLTKKLLEKSGMTRKPDVDFMTSFLSSAKPSRTLNRGNENLQIVPFGSDMHNIGTQSNNMNIVGRSEANSVDQFGVADIYTRQQQLNPSQWKQFMAKVAQDATTAHAQNQSPFNYQTQNLIGASETKPLTGNLPRSNVGTATRNSPPSLQAFIRPVTGTTSTNGEFTMFAAPGMSGHKSVTIPNFMPGSVNQRPSFSVPEKQPASTATTGNVGPQQRNEFVSSQPTALRTNHAASSNTFNQRRPDQPNNLVGLGGADTLQGSSIANSAGQFTAGNNQANVQSQQGQLGQVGGQTPGDMNTFSLGQSILISDGTVPEFARPLGNMGGTQVPPGASPNFQTLGQPAIRSNVDTVNTQQTQRFQPGGQSVMSQFNNQGSPSFPQMDANPNMPISFPSSGVPTVSRSSDFAIDANMGMRPMVPGMPQSGQAGQATSVDPTQASGVGTNAAKQPMSPTLFTSGNRLAVFGPANDVSGRQLVSRQIKPVPAMRVGVLAPVLNCRYSPDPSSEYYFIYKNGLTQHRFRCALGTAFDAMTCECSIRVSDHGDCLEVHMDFNEGVVVDSSLNRLPIGNENVEITNNSSPIPGIALFGGDSKLTIWRYQNYDFRDHVMLKVQFRAGVGGQRYQPLISNCDGSVDGPSLAIVYDNLMQEVQLILQTDNDTRKQLTFSVNPDEWNDVTYIYDGQEFIGIVNGVRRYVSKENPHLLGLIGGVIKSAPTQGLVEIRDAAIVLGHCPKYGFFRGAMVDIQIYTCIPKDFRLE